MYSKALLEIPVEGLLAGSTTIKIYKNEWVLQFYFPGPDLRYNGEFMFIRESQIDSYISAIRQNWEELQKMKELHLEGIYTKVGVNDMALKVVNGKETYLYVFCSGIYKENIFPIRASEISSEYQVNRFVVNLDQARNKALAAKALI